MTVTPGPSGADGPPALTVTDLTVRAGATAVVQDVSFTVGAGRRVGLIGASGSGKTLTCLAVAGLLPEGLTASGSVRLAGFDRDVLRARERDLAAVRGRLTGMVFQEPMSALDPTMRIDRQIVEAMRLHDSAGARAGRRARALVMLGAVGIDDPERVARSFPHELSGGQRQRVVIAIAMANRPCLLICDEPTTALDVTMQAKVLDLIDRQAAAAGSAVLFISHNLAVVASLCDELLVMWQGRIVERGPVVSVLEHPVHEHTRRLIADADPGGQSPGPPRGRP